MSLFGCILNSIDEDTYKHIQEDTIENDLNDKGVIVRPECLNVALNINMYVIVAGNHVNSSNDVTEEQKQVWKKYIKPFFNQIIMLFLTWAFNSIMDSFMLNVEPFEKTAEIMDNYHYP